jgi:hypothetical protein
LACSGASLRADPGWIAQTDDFRHQSVSLASLEDQGARVTPDGTKDSLLIPLDNLLLLERTVALSPTPTSEPGKQSYTLLLWTGDHITGQPVALVDEILTWNSPALGEIKLSIRQIRAISRLAQPPGLDDEHKDDQIVLANKDSVHGIVTSLADAKVNVESGDAATSIRLDTITTIYFTSTEQKSPGLGRAFRVRFTDSSSLRALGVTCDGSNVQLTLADNSKHQIPLAGVQSIEQLNGPVSYLANLTPSVNQQVWFSDVSFANLLDQTVTLTGRDWRRSIVAHADAKLVFPLDGSYKVFRTQYCVDPQRNARSGVLANLSVRILLDDKVIYEDKSVRAGKLPPVLWFDLGPAKSLTLEVGHNDATATQGWLDFLEPTLVRNKPVAPAAATPASAPTTAE